MFQCRRFLTNFPFIVSSAMFLFLLAPANPSGVKDAILGAAAFSIISCFFDLKASLQNNFRWKYVILSAGICLLAGIGFSIKWEPSSMIARFCEKVGVSNLFFLKICGILGALIALPAIVSILCVASSRDSLINPKAEKFLGSSHFLFLCAIGSLVGIMAQISFSFSLDIWVDEAFSLSMIKHSYWKMIQLTAQDVHPPLYYIILKFLVDGFFRLFQPESVIYPTKLVSVIPYILLLLLAFTKIRKNWGNYVAGLFAVCIVGMPNLISYGVEIRMYSWALFFVTAAFLCAYDIAIRGRFSDWVKFVLFSLAAAYTHYFACVAAAFGYLTLLIWFWKNNRKSLKSWLCACAATILGYLPWLFVLLRQLSVVKESYWIAPITFDTIGNYLSFVLGSSAALVAIIGILRLVTIPYGASKTFSLSGICYPFGVILVGVLASLLIRPVFVERYVVPSLACLWLGAALAYELQKDSRWKIMAVVVILGVSGMNIFRFIQNQTSYQAESNATFSFYGELSKSSVLVFDNPHVYRTAMVEQNAPCFLWQAPESESSVSYSAVESNLTKLVYGQTNIVHSVSAFTEWDQMENDIYLVLSKQGDLRDSLLNGDGYSCEYVGTYRIENNVEIYQVHLDSSHPDV